MPLLNVDNQSSGTDEETQMKQQTHSGEFPVSWIPTYPKFLLDNHDSEQCVETSPAKAQRGAACWECALL